MFLLNMSISQFMGVLYYITLNHQQVRDALIKQTNLLAQRCVEMTAFKK